MCDNEKANKIETTYQHKLSMLQYGRYVINGGIVGIIAVILREFIARLAPADTPTYYTISIVAVYAAGIVLSFILHKVFTFKVKKHRWQAFGSFILVALAGAFSTLILSFVLRYALGFDEIFGEFGATASFAVATFISSLLTYWMNAKHVFSNSAVKSNQKKGQYSLNFMRSWGTILNKFAVKDAKYGTTVWVWMAFIGFIVLKLWLVRGQELVSIGYNVHDDRLFLNLAYSILRGEWLGDYNNLTLAKGPFYPLWIAFNFVLGIPLLLAQHILYVIACLILVIAIKPIFNKPVTLVVLFIVILFNPMSYTDGAGTRVVREGIYPALSILVVACTIGIAVRYDCKLKKLLYWTLGLGISLSSFWLTREEGVWIVPFVVVTIVVTIAKLIVARVTDWKKRISICLLPFIILLLGIGLVSGINLVKYGTFNTVEFKSDNFLAAYGALTRVQPIHWNPRVPVSKETRFQIYSVSPAFAELRPFLEGDLGKGWGKTSQMAWANYENNNEIIGGFFMWALRDAVAAVGYYKSAQAAEEYYNRLAKEVNNACEQGKIESGRKRATMTPPWHKDYTRLLLRALLRTKICLVNFMGFTANPSSSLGNEESLEFFRGMTNEQLTLETDRVLISGWMFSPDSPISFVVRKQDGEIADAKVKTKSSLDVYQHFLTLQKDIEYAREARFEIESSSSGGEYLDVRIGKNLFKKLPLDGKVTSIQTPELYFHVDSFGYEKSSFSPQLKVNTLKISILNKVGLLYQAIMPILTKIAFLGYIFLTIQLFRRKADFLVWIINSCLLIIIFIRMFIISLIDISSFAAINTGYLSPAYPMLLIFNIFVLTWFIKYVYNLIKVLRMSN